MATLNQSLFEDLGDAIAITNYVYQMNVYLNVYKRININVVIDETMEESFDSIICNGNSAYWWIRLVQFSTAHYN